MRVGRSAYEARIRRRRVAAAALACAVVSGSLTVQVGRAQDARPGPANGIHHAAADTLSGPAMLLADLVAEVRAHNPSLRASREDALAMETVSRQVSALPDPMFMGMVQPTPRMTEWRVEQTFPFPGKLGLQGDIADLGATIADYDVETLEQDLVARAKEAYYELGRIQEQIALTREFQQRLSDFEEIAATQYEVGIGAQQSILKAQVEKNALTQRLIELEERQRSTLEALSWLTNEPIEAPLRVRVEATDVALPEEDVLAQVAAARRPEVAALRTAGRRAAKQIDLGRKQYYPDIGLNATYFDLGASNQMSATGQDAVAVGFSIKLPVQRDRIRAQIEEAQARAMSVESRKEALETSLTTQIADLQYRIRQEAEQLALYRDLLLPQALTNVEATLSAYTTGRTDFLNLLDSERMLFQLRVGYEDAVARYMKATAALERALGVDSLAQLQNVDALLRDQTEND